LASIERKLYMAVSRFLASMSASVGGNLPTVMDTFRPSG
jgi:hypothetical protein